MFARGEVVRLAQFEFAKEEEVCPEELANLVEEQGVQKAAPEAVQANPAEEEAGQGASPGQD